MIKKYVKVLMQLPNIEQIQAALLACASLAENPEHQKILKSCAFSKEKKLSYLEDALRAMKVNLTPEFVNFLKLLAESNRLDLLGAISAELEHKLQLEKGIFTGEIYSQNELDSELIAHHEQVFSKHFNKQIKLKNVIVAQDGVKIYLPDLGCEIGLSNAGLAEKIKEFIIKAI